MKTKQKKNDRPRHDEDDAVEDLIMDLTDINNPTIIVLYGKPGTGKTTIASSLPKPLLIIDVKDKGTDSAKGPDLKRGDIKVFQVNKFEDINTIYDYIKRNKGKFKSVVIDHMTSLQGKALDQVKEDEKKDYNSQRMFGMAASMMNEIINLYKDLTDDGIVPCFICQDRKEDGEGEDEDQLTPEVGPGMMPSVGRNLCAAARIIGHAYLQQKKSNVEGITHKKIEYRLRLGPNPYYITKVTRPKGTPCPDYLVNATYADLEKIISGNWTAPVKKKKKKIKRKGA